MPKGIYNGGIGRWQEAQPEDYCPPDKFDCCNRCATYVFKRRPNGQVDIKDLREHKAKCNVDLTDESKRKEETTPGRKRRKKC